jgi:Holliday junction resolvase
MNSKRKGKAGELDFAAFLRTHGFDARRGQQYAGGLDSPDIVSTGLSAWHVEVKRVEDLNLAAACAQAARDSGGKPWVVAHRRNRGVWFVTLDSDECHRLLRRAMPFLDVWPITGPRPITLDAELFLEFLRLVLPRLENDQPGNSEIKVSAEL